MAATGTPPLMMSSQQSRDVTEPGRFARNGMAADPHAAAVIRSDFTCWLRRFIDITEIRLCDVVLAVNEALANAVEFAYVAHGMPGEVDVEAVHDKGRDALTVTVSDQGHWRDGDPLHNDRSRGRGIALMRTLADAVLIDTSALGTNVCLRFDGIDARRPDEALVR